MRVVLIPTGKMERKALAASLLNIFPDVEFECEPPDGTPDSLLPNSFTSSTLPSKVHSAAEQNVDKLVRWLVATVEPGRKGRSKPALVILVEDLELANVTQPEVVQRELSAAIQRHIERLRADPRRVLDPDLVAQALRERASFHLMVPMTESYFFGDPMALAQATPRAGDARLMPGADVEAFQVTDPAFLLPLPPGAACPHSADNHCPWDGEDRSRHPKKYVQYLNRSEQEPFCTNYKETQQGVAGLRALRWKTVLTEPNAAPYARVLIEDIAQAIDVECPVDSSARDRGPTSIFRRPPALVLRNL
jgi:hypothetical protein